MIHSRFNKISTYAKWSEIYALDRFPPQFFSRKRKRKLPRLADCFDRKLWLAGLRIASRKLCVGWSNLAGFDRTPFHCGAQESLRSSAKHKLTRANRQHTSSFQNYSNLARNEEQRLNTDLTTHFGSEKLTRATRSAMLQLTINTKLINFQSATRIFILTARRESNNKSRIRQTWNSIRIKETHSACKCRL